MSLLINILLFVVVLSFLMLAHEFGHFVLARIFKVEVEEFGLGLPPRIVKLFTWKGTDFTLNWLPIGAFVRPKGENDPAIAGGLAAANPWVRLIVLLGGPLMNVLTALIVFSFVFSQIGAPDTKKVEILAVNAGSPAAQAGFQVGDIVQEINGVKIDSTNLLADTVKQNLGKDMSVILLRKGQTLPVSLTPRTNPPAGEGAMGITMGNPLVTMNWFQSLPFAFDLTVQQSQQIVMAPIKMISGQLSPSEGRVVGVKGIFDMFNQVRTQEAVSAAANPTMPANLNTLWFVATLSIALGITNLLPIPALDGGRILFVLPELLFRKRVPARFENAVHLIGFAALLILMVVMTVNDIAHPIVLP